MEGVDELTGAVDQHAGSADQGESACRRIGVVGGLRLVNGVVGMDDVILAACVVAEFQRTIGDYLVHVHVGGGAGTALQHVDGELVVKLAGGHVFAGSVDECCLICVDIAEFAVGAGTGLLDLRIGADEFRMVADGDAGDGEIIDGA